MNVYDHFSAKLHKLIYSAIDDLPNGINLDPSQSASFSQSTTPVSRQSNANYALGGDDDQSSFAASEEGRASRTFGHTAEPVFKKPRNQKGGGG